MTKLLLGSCVMIMRAAYAPIKRRELAAVPGLPNSSLQTYLGLLVSTGYLVKSGARSDPSYISTERAVHAIGAYKMLEEKGLVKGRQLTDEGRKLMEDASEFADLL